MKSSGLSVEKLKYIWTTIFKPGIMNIVVYEDDDYS